jgi:hypothetical protein
MSDGLGDTRKVSRHDATGQKCDVFCHNGARACSGSTQAKGFQLARLVRDLP